MTANEKRVRLGVTGSILVLVSIIIFVAAHIINSWHLAIPGIVIILTGLAMCASTDFIEDDKPKVLPPPPGPPPARIIKFPPPPKSVHNPQVFTTPEKPHRIIEL